MHKELSKLHRRILDGDLNEAAKLADELTARASPCLHKIAEPAAQQAVQPALGWAHKLKDGKIGNYFYTYEPHCDCAVRDNGGEKIAVVAATHSTPQGLDADTFEQRMSDWSQEDAQDAARWREALRHIGANNNLGGAQYVIRGLQAPMNVMRGSVAEHFTKSIDAALAAHANQASGWLAHCGSPIECYYRRGNSLCENFTTTAYELLTPEPSIPWYACPVCSRALKQEAAIAAQPKQGEQA